jgi:choline dehydrogenase-like flavoprotein
VRSSGADYLIGHDNLTLRTTTYVDRVILDEGPSGSLVATGVELCDADGNRTKVVADKEIIVSAGAFNSPTILMRSGIGAKSEVEKHGISSRIDLPGVGKNLHDHLVRNAFSKDKQGEIAY